MSDASGPRPPGPTAAPPSGQGWRGLLTRRAGAAPVAVATVTIGIILVNVFSGSPPRKATPAPSSTASSGPGAAPLVPGGPGPASGGASGSMGAGSGSPGSVGPTSPTSAPPGGGSGHGGPAGLGGKAGARAGHPGGTGVSSNGGLGIGSSDESLLPGGAQPELGAGPPAHPVASRAHAPVVIYNDSRIVGLGAKAAARVRAAGFEVKLVDGLAARVSVTTIYYDPPDAAAAQALAGAVPGIVRVLPRPPWLLPTGTLILVVTRDFPV